MPADIRAGVEFFMQNRKAEHLPWAGWQPDRAGLVDHKHVPDPTVPAASCAAAAEIDTRLFWL